MASDLIMHTSAPDVYDGFGTETLAIVGGDNCNGLPVRQVRIPADAIEWQISRYGSGCHRFTTDRTPLDMYVRFGDWTLTLKAN